MSEKIGVYVCHCGTNIAGTVNVEQVAQWAGGRLKDRGVIDDAEFQRLKAKVIS